MASQRFGIQETIDRENTDLTLQDISMKLGTQLNTLEYQSIPAQTEALYSGEIDAMVINEMYRSLILEKHPDFDTETRVLDAFTYEQEVEESSKADIQVSMSLLACICPETTSGARSLSITDVPMSILLRRSILQRSRCC